METYTFLVYKQVVLLPKAHQLKAANTNNNLVLQNPILWGLFSITVFIVSKQIEHRLKKYILFIEKNRIAPIISLCSVQQIRCRNPMASVPQKSSVMGLNLLFFLFFFCFLYLFSFPNTQSLSFFFNPLGSLSVYSRIQESFHTNQKLVPNTRVTTFGFIQPKLGFMQDLLYKTEPIVSTL